MNTVLFNAINIYINIANNTELHIHILGYATFFSLFKTISLYILIKIYRKFVHMHIYVYMRTKFSRQIFHLFLFTNMVNDTILGILSIVI